MNEQETSVCMCCIVKIKQKNNVCLTNFRILLILSHIYIYTGLSINILYAGDKSPMFLGGLYTFCNFVNYIFLNNFLVSLMIHRSSEKIEYFQKMCG